MTILYAGRMPANHREHPTSAEGSFGLVPALHASDCKTLTVREIRIKYQKLDGWRGRFYLGRLDRGVFSRDRHFRDVDNQVLYGPHPGGHSYTCT